MVTHQSQWSNRRPIQRSVHYRQFDQTQNNRKSPTAKIVNLNHYFLDWKFLIMRIICVRAHLDLTLKCANLNMSLIDRRPVVLESKKLLNWKYAGIFFDKFGINLWKHQVGHFGDCNATMYVHLRRSIISIVGESLWWENIWYWICVLYLRLSLGRHNLYGEQ